MWPDAWPNDAQYTLVIVRPARRKEQKPRTEIRSTTKRFQALPEEPLGFLIHWQGLGAVSASSHLVERRNDTSANLYGSTRSSMLREVS